MDRPICFFSDYGYTDDFAGVCRAVIARLAPDVRVIDVTHGLPERDVLAGAVVLRNTLPYMPDRAVILAVVDPGVGGPRRPVALRSHGDRLFVGPDNGLLMHAVALDGGVSTAYELSNQELWLSPLSATFHGRDIFAPVAARLAAGLELASCGAPVQAESLDRIDLPEPRTFNVAMLQEHIRSGQRIECFRLSALIDDTWRVVAESTVIGYKRLLRFAPVTAQRIRIEILESRIRPTLAAFGIFYHPKL